MTDNAYAMILAGGRGERFWPLSTALRPKQLLSLVGGKPLLVAAVERLEGVVPREHIVIVTNAALVDPIRRLLPDLAEGHILGEPVGRDTAAACALGLAWVKGRDPDAVLCVVTADHVIADRAVFQHTLSASLAIARGQDVLITIGIAPRSASTGFGYIETLAPAERRDGIDFLRAARFVEKPDRATAESYLRAGNYYWNSGMFVWSVRAFEGALQRHAPRLGQMAHRLAPHLAGTAPAALLAAEYAALEPISVDYAIMEKADNILMAKGTFAWDDVGSWSAVAAHLQADSAGNAVVGRCEQIDSSGNLVVSPDRLTALIGVEGLVVVQSAGATLVCPRARAQDVKQLVRKLTDDGRYVDLL